MAISLDSAVLNAYRNASFENENTIINVDGKGIKGNGIYGGALSAISRSKEDKEANNKARAQLLQALGKAFSINGANTDEQGKITFSKDFMKNLEKILGKDFKIGDFGINSKGEVTSGKPLTMRRIKAIVKKADFVSNGDFNISVYSDKLAVIKKELKIDKLSPSQVNDLAQKNRGLHLFSIASKALDYLSNEADRGPKVHDAYQFAKDCDELDTYNGDKYQYFNAMENDFVDLSNLDDFDTYISERIGVVFHRSESNFDSNNPETIVKLKTYLNGLLQSFVKHLIDNYITAQAQGKLDEFLKNLLDNPGVCLEDKCTQLTIFENQHLSELSAQEIAELNRIVETNDVKGGKPKTADFQIFAVLNELQAQDMERNIIEDSMNWENCAQFVKDRLVGQTAVIVEFNNGEFNEVKEDGKTVIRKITAEDIDRLGPSCVKVINGD